MPFKGAEVGEEDALDEVPQAGVDRAKEAEVLPNKVKTKTRKRPPTQITHLQVAANNTRNGVKVLITVSSH